MKRPSFIKQSGPYKVASLANGLLEVEPAWPQFPKWTEEDGGGPGLLSRLALAENLERWLNASYEEPTRQA